MGKVYSESTQVEFETSANTGRVYGVVAQVEYSPPIAPGRIFSEAVQVEYETSAVSGRVHSIILQVEYEPRAVTITGTLQSDKIKFFSGKQSASLQKIPGQIKII